MNTRAAAGADPQTRLTAAELFTRATATHPASVKLWDHNCPVEGSGFFVGAGEPCAWCGAEES